jgi:hypothetical protein
MHSENGITENDMPETGAPEENKENLSSPSSAQSKRKRKKHNSALLAIAKARSEATHRTTNGASDGLHPIGTNITYKDGEGYYKSNPVFIALVTQNV